MWRLGLVAVLFLALAGCSRSESPGKFLQEGFIHFQKQDYGGAIKNYEQAIALGAKSPNAYNMLGLSYRFKSQQNHDSEPPESEIISFQKAVEIDPRYLPAVINLATAYYSRGDKAKAAVWFKKALELNPHHPDKAEFEKMIAEGTPPPPVPVKKSHGRENLRDRR